MHFPHLGFQTEEIMSLPLLAGELGGRGLSHRRRPLLQDARPLPDVGPVRH
jgi:hypothetical protein